jgi:hypothetical protein
VKKLGEREGYYVHWHWYIDRLCDISIAVAHGDITQAEFDSLRPYYEWLWMNCPPIEVDA